MKHLMDIETTNPRPPIGFTEVTLRDGEQQEKVHAVMPVEDRIEVFDQIVSTGIGRIEIGHLGNEHDIDFARALIRHIGDKSAVGDENYDAVTLQVLFGSQPELIDTGIEALNGFDPDRVVLHIYDRASPHLRGLASEPYSNQQSTKRVAAAAGIALGKGFKNFSVSGEGTVDPDLTVDEAVDDFYLPVIRELESRGASSININLPNTFGSSLGGEWGKFGLAVFNDRLKSTHPDITTSIHAHNDYNSAAEYAIAALESGFDYVEGTLIGMGERAGNVALSDVMVRLLEDARMIAEIRAKGEAASHVAKMALHNTLWSDRILDERIVNSLAGWYQAAENISNIYGTLNRFYQTSLGNQEAYGAGSGPHAHANQEMLRDPVNKPLWQNYGRVALIHAVLGRPEARQILVVDPERIRQITLATHAAGGSTERVLTEAIEECSDEDRTNAIRIAQAEIARIVGVVSEESVYEQPVVLPQLVQT